MATTIGRRRAACSTGPSAALDYDLSRLTFVDYGAGKGRVLLLASQHPFAAVGGIEFAEELHDDAIMNIAQFPRSRMKCRNVECVLDDASQVGPPDGEAVHYFFNPFSREVFAEVLHNIVVSYRKRPRRLYLILVDQPEVTDLIDHSGVFQRLELPLVERTKVQAVQPLRRRALPLARLTSGDAARVTSRRASSAGSTTTSCIGRSASCRDRHICAPAAPSAPPRGSPTG